ncbi:guanosine-5'-triphosphate,3'-diphosphate pyrophosphatase [Thalassotalea sp. PS06]|uniref:Ppx/GppA phosphatase family protein n=1 Tax=Thalassotalea sp. PS06 TaxID=2594005 RepID=UPI001163B405|nr:guanosine-5'-triphosphate,3'-diphosphate pyrophosphatase [Thalassotalea sp. PS06]QDP02716.1 guanosine-5'-triphosphate,3'-diphosphate pyrophosphatase [Thalassotalea sp. PS06]
MAEKPSHNQPLYAVIDLGSNSFHMMISRLVADSVQVVDKVKRKVRLASGLNEQGELDSKSMARGWECLSFFAERLQDIPAENIQIVATATLRIAKNAKTFLERAEQILGHKITVISGDEEAKLIYLGVAHTTISQNNRLVIDIGGASTELIVGQGFDPQLMQSLDMGCVTFNQQFFPENIYSEAAFKAANAQAKKVLTPFEHAYRDANWESALGVSGTLQAIMEVLTAQGRLPIINLVKLQELKQQVLACGNLNSLDITGLVNERKPVFASGLAILIALFENLKIDELQLAGGAIREGLLYELLPNMRNVNIRMRTLNGLMARFNIDERQAYRVADIADQACQQLLSTWQFAQHYRSILQSACVLHEIGLQLEYKGNKQHAVYILQHADLAGFSTPERLLLCALVGNYKTDVDVTLLNRQTFAPLWSACQLLAILRLSVILSKRRKDDVMPEFSITGVDKTLKLTLPDAWLKQHPLVSAELKQEIIDIAKLDIELSIIRI